MRDLRGWVAAFAVALAVSILGLGAPAGSASPSGDLGSAASADGQFTKVTTAINGSYIPLMGAFDCDADLDPTPFPESYEQAGIVLYQPGPGADYLWTDLGASGGKLTKTQVPLAIGGTYLPIVGDFDGDRCSDIVWYAPGPAADFIWWGSPTGFIRGRSLTINGTYTPVSFDYEWAGGMDIFWYAANGTESIWRATQNRNAPFVSIAAPQVSGSQYRPVAFWDGVSGGSQILWHGPGSIADSVWKMAGGSHTVTGMTLNGSYTPVTCTTWVILYGGSAPSRFLTRTGVGYGSYDISAPAGARVAGSEMTPRCSAIFHRPGAASDQVWLPNW